MPSIMHDDGYVPPTVLCRIPIIHFKRLVIIIISVGDKFKRHNWSQSIFYDYVQYYDDEIK